MRQYAGQQLTTSVQAETYADHFIGNHLIKIGGGKTYAQAPEEAVQAGLFGSDVAPCAPRQERAARPMAMPRTTAGAVSGGRTSRTAWSARSGW